MRNDAQTIRHTVAKYGIPSVIILRRLSLLLQLDKHMICDLLQENLQLREIGWKSVLLKISILISVSTNRATSNHRFKSLTLLSLAIMCKHCLFWAYFQLKLGIHAWTSQSTSLFKCVNITNYARTKFVHRITKLMLCFGATYRFLS